MPAPDTDARSVLDAVKTIVPTLRDNALEAEERGWIPTENIKLLEQAGVFRIAVPRRFGGLDLSLAGQTDIVTEIARGCGSTAWVVNAWVSSAWMITQYPEETQKEIFETDSLRVSGAFTPTGTAKPVDGGWLLNGVWRFNTGIRGADWNILATKVDRADGEHEERYAVVPAKAMTLADDWDVTAASATGSVTSSVTDLFVPTHRTVDGVEVLEGLVTGRANTGATGRNYGLTGYVMALSAGVYIGLAQAALEAFLERIPGKGLAYSRWAEQRQHPYLQYQAAAAANMIAAAVALADDWTRTIQDAADAGSPLPLAERALIRARIAYTVQLTRDAVETLHKISGASVIYRSVSFQRIHRDIQGLALHGLMAPLGGFEAYGRVLMGLDPGTDYL